MDMLRQPVEGPSVWTGADLEGDRSWTYALSHEQVADLDRALCEVKRRGLDIAEITRADFPLPSLEEDLARLLSELRDGRGFAAVRGFPVDGYALEDVEKMYWGLCTHLGTGVTQNSEAGLIHCVTDGQRRPQMGTRGVGNPGPVGLHIDLADCVALCCVRQAPDDPFSTVASAMHIYNEILCQHPEWLPRLYEGFVWTRRSEQNSDEPPVSNYKVPAYSYAQGVLTCRFNAGWSRTGMQELDQALTGEEEEIFRFIQKVASEHCFRFPLHPGDIAFCNNYTVFHGRAGHDPVEEEERKRLLLRIWMDLENVRPFSDEGLVRYGTIRYGRLGWTASDLISGRYREGHRLRADGVPEASV
jgi:hypothetical protein